MSYTIGQQRFNGSGCVTEVAGTSLEEQLDTATQYRDLKIVYPGGGTFSTDQDYYLHMAIPQDMNYSMTFNVKLFNQQVGTSSYQFLKQVTIQRGSGGENNRHVVLYEKQNNGSGTYGPTGVDIIEDKNIYRNNIETVKDRIYYDRDGYAAGYPQGDYYLGIGGMNGYQHTVNYNSIQMVETWKVETSGQNGFIDVVFCPLENTFDAILIEMERETVDGSIQRSNSSGETEYGRKVDRTKAKATLYLLTNLAASLIGTSTNDKAGLTRVGIWSHPGLMMSINGEEIHVGPSGYYEEDAVKVTSLGIVATSYADNWTLDYVLFDGEDET